jgi:hypothetical protein
MERDYPPEYYQAIVRMAEAAKAWIRANPFACLQLEPLNADKVPGLDAAEREQLRALIASAPPGRVGLITDLTGAIEWWAGNESTRQMLHAMDDATDRQCSYQMAKAALDALVFPKSEESN